MTLRTLCYLARISEQNASIARMQAENSVWIARGQDPAYVDGHFLECQQELHNIWQEMEGDRRMGVE